WKGWAILLRQKQKKLIMLPSETMIWQPEFTDKILSRKPGAVHHLSRYNRLVKEKAELEERLSDISVEIERMSAGGFNGKLSFPWESSSLLRNHQQGSV
ncbi:hypothetical protein U9523_26190, partial [Escherichia coli]